MASSPASCSGGRRAWRTAAAADAAQRSGALESPLSKLEASIDLSQKLKTLKAQLVQEKAESEVAIAQRERVIQQLRGQLDARRVRRSREAPSGDFDRVRADERGAMMRARAERGKRLFELEPGPPGGLARDARRRALSAFCE